LKEEDMEDLIPIEVDMEAMIPNLFIELRVDVAVEWQHVAVGLWLSLLVVDVIAVPQSAPQDAAVA